MSRPASILVAGGGPAGLALALQAHAHGGHVRVVERRPEAFRPSRALILHARTLEVLRPLGVTEALLARAQTAPAVDLRLGRRVRRISLGDLELPDTAFPHVSLVRQMDVEEVLTQALAGRGVEVERGVELVGVRDDGANVRAALRAALRSAAVTREGCFDFVAGCDGPASTVRAQAGIGWPGRPYAAEIVLADAEHDLASDAAHVAVGRHGVLFAFPLGERASWRLLATRPTGPEQLPFGSPGPPVLMGELQELIDQAGLGVRLSHLAWSARVRV